jgi:putative oxygen-independent coproporphyrinogen III oxidase
MTAPLLASADRPATNPPADRDVPLGVYVHVPFCRWRCDYCAFATWTDRHELTAEYLAAVKRDVTRTFARESRGVETVFVGGGTPSFVPADLLVAVLSEIRVVTGAEITIECNPDDVTDELLAAYAAGGVTRISLGVQSMVPRILDLLGRRHDPDNVIHAVGSIRNVGFQSFNLDLIYGSATERLDEWRTTLHRALELDPPHISAYGLTVEPGTPLAADPARYPDDDVQAEEYELADDLLGAAGLANYEVSNWARSGHECRHNLLYWRQYDYLGFGCAAHSHVAGRRWWNVRTPERYIGAVGAGQPTEAAGETLDAETRRLEGLQLSLRTTAGVPRDALDGDALEGLVEPRDDHWVLTRQGRLLANEVAVRLR